jgi:hypothetical protein
LAKRSVRAQGLKVAQDKKEHAIETITPVILHRSSKIRHKFPTNIRLRQFAQKLIFKMQVSETPHFLLSLLILSRDLLGDDIRYGDHEIRG